MLRATLLTLLRVKFQRETESSMGLVTQNRVGKALYKLLRVANLAYLTPEDNLIPSHPKMSKLFSDIDEKNHIDMFLVYIILLVKTNNEYSVKQKYYTYYHCLKL